MLIGTVPHAFVCDEGEFAIVILKIKVYIHTQCSLKIVKITYLLLVTNSVPGISTNFCSTQLRGFKTYSYINLRTI